MQQYHSLVGRINSTDPGFTSTGAWRTPSVNSVISHANDVAINPTTNRVYITGDFRNSLFFTGATFLNTTAVTDGYMAEFNATTGAITMFKKCGALSGETGKGSGVDIGNSGRVFFTGHVSNNITGGLYGYTSATFTGGSTTKQRGYILALSPTNTYVWHKRIEAASTGDVEPSDVFARTGTGLFITGTLTDDITVPVFSAPATDYTSATAGLRKVFMYELTVTGSDSWINTTADNTAGSEHLSSRITASTDYVYSTGTYAGEMNYNVISGAGPASGALISSPVMHYNTYIVRNELMNGHFKSAVSDELITSDITETGALKLYPNPSSGMITLVLPDELSGSEVTISLTDASGKLILRTTEKADQLTNLDLSIFESGIYFIRVENGEQYYMSKVIKE
jgi:hypothetical protein